MKYDSKSARKIIAITLSVMISVFGVFFLAQLFNSMKETQKVDLLEYIGYDVDMFCKEFGFVMDEEFTNNSCLIVETIAGSSDIVGFDFSLLNDRNVNFTIAGITCNQFETEVDNQLEKAGFTVSSETEFSKVFLRESDGILITMQENGDNPSVHKITEFEKERIGLYLPDWK